MKSLSITFYLAVVVAALSPVAGYTQSGLDLVSAKLHLVVKDPGVLLRTSEVLQQEIEKRSGLKIATTEKPEAGEGSYIMLLLEKDEPKLPPALRKAVSELPPLKKEGFKLVASARTNTVVIVGKDARGLLYGVGRFLRKAEMAPGVLRFPATIALASSPQYRIRGHQLGYRPKTNAYDAFTVPMFDQYIRDLALFGANSIEIMPPRTDDDFTSRHMKLPAIRMIAEQSRICKSYGLDVWMWYPNMEKDYSDAQTIEKELAEREEVFKVLPKLDAVFIPGGDPGDLEPDQLFEWMGKMAAVLRKHHPQAKLWVSPQSFRPTDAWFDAFFRHVNKEYNWLGGIVFGPWVKLTIADVRKRVKATIPIRNYPDITHNIACQYPVPDWDAAWAATLGREAVNPRPVDEKLFHNAVAPYCVGSLSYSEGTNDDLNKFVWSDQDWDASTPVTETVRDYARLFFGAQWAEAGVHALMALETNQKGPLLGKQSVERTLWQWQYMEKNASPALLSNPRFQMGLIRAYFDAYTRERLVYETRLEQEAREELSNAPAGSVRQSLERAAGILELAWKKPIRPELREKCMDLADSLYKSIGAQLTVSKHGAMAGRGNFIDNIQFPLNDAPWLLHELERIGKLGSEAEQKEAIRQLLHRTDPGPGEFYDHFGNPESRHRVVGWLPLEKDPGSQQSPRTGFGMSLSGKEWYSVIPGVGERVPLAPRSWSGQVETLYDEPLLIRYDGLDPAVTYRVRVAYTGRFKSTVRMQTDDGKQVHDYIKIGTQPLYEFDVPQEATRDGKVIFRWNCLEGERGSQVSEIWLMKTGETK